MKYEKKFLSPEQEQRLAEAQLQSSQTVHEFATPEDVLRFDAKQMAVPDGIAQRLGSSLQRKSAAVPVPWWKRLFQ